MIDTRLIVDSVAASPRVAHENNVIGTMNILAACGGPDSPVRKLVFKSSAHYYGCEQDDPRTSPRTMRRPHPPRDADRARHRRGRARRRRVRASATGRDRDRAALRQRARAGPAHQPRGWLSLPAVPSILGFDPRYQFIARGRHRRRARRTPTRHDLPGVYNAAGDGVLVLSEVARAARQAARAACCRRGGRASRPACCAAPGSGSRPRCSSSCATAAGSTTASSRRPATPSRATSRETVQAFAEHLRVARPASARGRGLPVRARGRGVPALEPGGARRRRRSASAG